VLNPEARIEMNDLRLALRLLLKNRGFSAVAILSLAIGIGANTTIFSLLNGLLLRPLPGREPGRLVTVYTSDSSGPLYSTSSYPDFLDFRASDQFDGLAAHTLQPVLLTLQGESSRAIAGLVSGNAFEMLGLHGSYGRMLLPSEETPNQDPVVVLSHAYWRSHFASDPAVVGRALALNGRPYTIVGVGPEGFTGLLRGVSQDVFVPLSMSGALNGDGLDNRGSRGLMLIGRLREGATPESARASLAVTADRLYREFPNYWTNKKNEPRVVSVLPENASRIMPQIRTPVSAFLGVLLAIVAMVLLLACSNVANLLLARATARRREIAVRVALGASRLQIVRQLLAESVLLSLCAGALGLALALAAMRLITTFPSPLPVNLALGLELDPRVLLFTLALSIGTGLIFGLMPALGAARVAPMEAFRQLSAASLAAKLGLRNVLVVGQVAGSVLLLVCTGLFLRSLLNAEAIDPGFSTKNVTLFSVDLESSGYDEARGKLFFEQIRERLAALPGVESVSLASRLPLSFAGGRRSLDVPGYAKGKGEDMEVHFSVVGPDYFRTMRTDLVEGRGFTAEDAAGAGSVVVNQAFARKYFAGKPALQQRVVMHHRVNGEFRETPVDVIGVARDGKVNSLGEDPTPFIYYPLSHLYESEMTVLLRTSGSRAGLSTDVRQAVAALDPVLPVFDFKTLEQHLGLALLPVRAVSSLLGLMGTVALFLAALGLHGVLSYSVSRRTREIGVRMALGAGRDLILRMVLATGAKLTTAGLGLGLIAAFAATRFLTFLLYGISPLDPVTFVLIPMILLAVGLGAAALPARRAARVQPAEALRDE